MYVENCEIKFTEEDLKRITFMDRPDEIREYNFNKLKSSLIPRALCYLILICVLGMLTVAFFVVHNLLGHPDELIIPGMLILGLLVLTVIIASWDLFLKLVGAGPLRLGKYVEFYITKDLGVKSYHQYKRIYEFHLYQAVDAHSGYETTLIFGTGAIPYDDKLYYGYVNNIDKDTKFSFIGRQTALFRKYNMR